MKQEEINQELRNGETVLTGSAKLRDKVLERIQRTIDGNQYLTISDLVREINEISALLMRHGARGRQYAVAVSVAVAKTVLLALLLIPERQKKTPGLKAPENSAEATAELERTIDAARSAAHVLFGTENATPTIEKWERERAKAVNCQLWEQLLTAPRVEGVAVFGGAGGQLLQIPAIPKALPAADTQKVVLQVKTVDEDSGVALVNVLSAANPDGPALRGLFDRRLPLSFDEDATPGIAKLLELAQVTDVHLQVLVTVARGLGASNTKLDALKVSEVLDEPAVRLMISRQLLAMKAVNGDLFVDEVGADAGT
jgi:hypothetical protein